MSISSKNWQIIACAGLLKMVWQYLPTTSKAGGMYTYMSLVFTCTGIINAALRVFLGTYYEPRNTLKAAFIIAAIRVIKFPAQFSCACYNWYACASFIMPITLGHPKIINTRSPLSKAFMWSFLIFSFLLFFDYAHPSTK
jgi:hypothetical protein